MFVVSFVILIFIGTVLLTLPISAKSGQFTNPVDALFTATSAACVTGLSVYETFMHWSYFGQGVLLVLIQCGGLGLAAFATGLTLLVRRRIGIRHLVLARESAGGSNLDVISLLRIVVAFTFAVEALGALLLMARFVPLYGGLGAWASVFVSVSAFCNAGFDLMGVRGEFSSLTTYADNPAITLTIMALIIIGGIGFLTWDDIHINKWHIRRYRMQSKVILTTTAVLLVIPAVVFFSFEFQTLPLGERILKSLFQAVTPRTAGFNTADLTVMSESAQFIIIVLMLIGGSPGSTAGGMKTTTIAVMIGNALAVFRRKEDAHFFGRRIEEDAVRTAATVFSMYVMLPVIGALVISMAEHQPMLICLFETASAIGTVGLSLGLTQSLGVLSQLILIVLMFFGRVGGLTLIFAALSGVRKNVSRLPQEKITVG